MATSHLSASIRNVKEGGGCNCPANTPYLIRITLTWKQRILDFYVPSKGINSLYSEWGLEEVGGKSICDWLRHDFDSAATWPPPQFTNKMAPCILSSPKPSSNINTDIKTSGRASGRHKTCNKGKRRARPSTSGRWTAMHRRDVIADGFRLIRNTRLHAKASPNLEEFMRDLRLPFLAPSLLDDNMSVEKYVASKKSV
jgi:hypothetical protein